MLNLFIFMKWFADILFKNLLYFVLFFVLTRTILNRVWLSSVGTKYFNLFILESNYAEERETGSTLLAKISTTKSPGKFGGIVPISCLCVT